MTLFDPGPAEIPVDLSRTQRQTRRNADLIARGVHPATYRPLRGRQFAATPARLACTATPAPNDVAELCNHAEFLGILPRNEMLAAFFVHDEIGWRIKGHASEPMHRWMAQWAVALRRPSDLGYDDDGYDLPALSIHAESVSVEIEQEGQLFATDLGGVGGRSKVRRQTLADRVERAVSLVEGSDEQWIVWCGLNDEADAIAKAIPDAVNVEGATDPEVKAEQLGEERSRAERLQAALDAHDNAPTLARVAFLEGERERWLYKTTGTARERGGDLVARALGETR